ncbi:MAG: hypothetical protein AAB610_02160 [Patescibacteria group bacterium]
METKPGRLGKMNAAIIGIIGLAVVFAIFQAGVFVGFSKASFLFRGGDNFYRAFEDGPGRMGGKMMFRDEFSGGHGAIGKIIKINLPTLVVLGPDNIEKIILTNDSTEVRQFRDASSLDKLSIDQHIAVLGAPNDDGQVVAKFIRIIPAPPAAGSISTNPQ